MMEVRDPITGAKIRWSGHPLSAGYAMPVSAVHPTRCMGRRLGMPEHPNYAVLFDGHICVAAVGWDAISRQVHRFDADTLEYVDTPMMLGALSTGTPSVEERQIPVFHRVPQIAATPNNLYCAINSGTQGANASFVLRRLAKGSSTFLSPTTFNVTTAAHWAGASVPQIGSSNISTAYYYGLRAVMTGETTERVFITGLVNTADGNSHSAIMYSDDLYQKGNSQAATWTLVPIITGGDPPPVMTHMHADDDMLVGVVTGLYGRDYVNVVYSEDAGETWFIAGVDEADHEIPSTGIAYNDADVTARQALADGDKTYAVSRVIYDSTNEKAYVSLVAADSDEGYGGNCESEAACYLIEVDMAARATTGCTQTVHGPFLSSENRSFDNGIQILDTGDGTLIGVVAMPEAGPEVAGYIDQADGGPTLRVYAIQKDGIASMDNWLLQHTVELPSGGSPLRYVDSSTPQIRHEWGYGHHQCFNGISLVDGSTDVAFVLVGDQRVTGVKQCFHMARIGLLALETGEVHVAESSSDRGQIIVPSNVGITGGYRGVQFTGVEDWREDLNFGDGAMSIVCIFNGAGSVVGAPDLPEISGSDRWGMPLAVFAEMRGQTTTSEPLRNSPLNGWGLFWNAVGLHYWIWNDFAGTDDPTASTYRLLRLTGLGSADAAGQWHRVCIVKAANASGDDSFVPYANGSVATHSDSGTLNTIGDVAEFAKLRWFSMVNNYSELIASCSVAAGVWVYNKALTATEAQNVTKSPGSTGHIGPEDSSLMTNLVARTYSGVGDWRAMSEARRRGYQRIEY